MSELSSSIFFGKVAEKKSVCLSDLIWFTIERSWYSKPISNILSASSMTKKVHLEVSEKAFFLKNSINLPGVETQISFYRCLISFQSSWGSTPPKTGSTLMLNNLQNLLKTVNICWQSSLVGAMTKAIGPSSFFVKAGYSSTWTRSGIKYARVLPDPVFATATMSLP